MGESHNGDPTSRRRRPGQHPLCATGASRDLRGAGWRWVRSATGWPIPSRGSHHGRRTVLSAHLFRPANLGQLGAGGAGSRVSLPRVSSGHEAVDRRRFAIGPEFAMAVCGYPQRGWTEHPWTSGTNARRCTRLCTRKRAHVPSRPTVRRTTELLAKYRRFLRLSRSMNRRGGAGRPPLEGKRQAQKRRCHHGKHDKGQGDGEAHVQDDSWGHSHAMDEHGHTVEREGGQHQPFCG